MGCLCIATWEVDLPLSRDRLELKTEECDPQTVTLNTNWQTTSPQTTTQPREAAIWMWDWAVCCVFLAGVPFPECPTLMGLGHMCCWEWGRWVGGAVRGYGSLLQSPVGLWGVFGFSSSTSENSKRQVCVQESGKARIILRFQTSPHLGC